VTLSVEYVDRADDEDLGGCCNEHKDQDLKTL